MLSGFDGSTFLKKFIANGMSPEAAKVQVDKARREAEATGITNIKGITEAEKNQLLKDLDNKEMSNDPNAPGISVAEHASNIIRMKFNNQNTVPTEGDLDGDGQVGLVKGDDGYVAYGEPGYGYNEMEGKDSFGDPVKGYEAFWAQLGPGDKGFYTEPSEHKRKRLRFEADKAPKSEVGSKPIVESTPERKAELDAELAKQQADRETDTRNRLLQEEERMKAEEVKNQMLQSSGGSEESSFDVSETATNIVNTTISSNEGYTPELQINVPDSTNSGVTIAGLDIGLQAGNADEKIEILSSYLNPQDLIALKAIQGKVGTEAQEALSKAQAKGLLTNESMGLTQQQLNEISARHLDLVLPSLYKAVGGEDKFLSLPNDLQSYIADVQFMTPGPVTLRSIKKALSSNTKSDWEAVADNYRNYYGAEENLDEKMKNNQVKSSNVRRVDKAREAVENYIKTLA